MKPSNSHCAFCQIIAGERQSKMVYQDETVSAFRDIHPVAPTHILIIPNKHIPSINEITPEDENLIGHLFYVARTLAHNEGVAQSGYRLIINTGRHANQTIYHLHLHLIAGQPVRYPMG